MENKKEKYLVLGEKNKFYYEGIDRTYSEAKEEKKALISQGFKRVRIKKIKM